MKFKAMMIIAAFAIAALASNASADWGDDFDSYATGSGLIGQGGWEGWDGGVGTDAIVSGDVARSAPNSVQVLPTTDVIQQFSGYTTGQWLFTAWQYIPSGTSGDQYFILLDTYAHGGPNHWAAQVRFGGGVVDSEFDYLTLPLIYNQWVEFRVEIDLDADNMAIYYGGTLLVQKPWTMGSSNDGVGVLNIACLDLFSNGGAAIYWDDIVFEQVVTAIQNSSWSQVKALF